MYEIHSIGPMRPIATDVARINQSINNKFADGAMVRHSSDESEAPEMAGNYSKAIEKR